MSGPGPEVADELAGGVYVHFPFCIHRCFYCDFNTYAPIRIPHRDYADAILAELAARARDLTRPARSLYFGGGTPSLWDPVEIARIVDAVAARPGLEADAEITLEANPAELTPERVGDLIAAGVNRLSVGVQAVHDDLLARLDRRHDAARALTALEAVAAAPLRSWSADLMFGLPGQTPERWAEDLRFVSGLGVPHLSVYALTLEPRTPLSRLVAQGRVTLPGDDAEAEMLFATRDLLREAGYEHYEISSYALPGHRAVHNTGYWELRPYLGLGAGAHGFAAGRRWWNLHRVGAYMAEAKASGLPSEGEERLDAKTLAFERVMTGLRKLSEGVDLPESEWAMYAEAVAGQRAAGTLEIVEGHRIRLTEQGLRYMNEVLLAFVP